MRYQWKLMLLMLAVSVLPLMIVRGFGVKAMRHIGRAFDTQTRALLTDNAEKHLKTVVDGYAAVIWREREQLEMGLTVQADAISRHLAGGIDRAALPEVYQKIQRLLKGKNIVRHCTGFADGSCSAYPADRALSADMDFRSRPWYRKSEAVHNELWTAPYRDPITGKLVMALSMPVTGPDGRFRGMTAIVVALSGLLKTKMLDQTVPPRTRPFLVYLTPHPVTGRREAAIIWSKDDPLLAYTGRRPLKHRWLASDNGEEWRALMRDCAAGRIGMRRMPYHMQDSLWVCGPVSEDACLIMITPYQTILEPADTFGKFMQTQINGLIRLTGIGMFTLIFVVVVLAILFARTVTKPVRVLTAGARRISRGEFDTRVHIASRDEFGEMGMAFNNVGPRLKELYQMRYALNVAMEVQQSLLPAAPPRKEGLDIAGASAYCDETGGDYYDFLENPNNPDLVGITVGDVSGHGIPSALLMATTRALLRQGYAMSGDLPRIMADINQQLATDVEDSGRFVTLIFAEINLQSASLTYVNAGHDPPLLYHRKNDVFTDLAGNGLPLAVDTDTPYTSQKHDFGAHHMLAIATDGIWETRNPEGGMFGKERFRDILRSNAEKPAKAIINAVIDELSGFRGDQPQEDDVTLVIVKRNGISG